MIEAVMVISILIVVLIALWCIDIVLSYKKESNYIKMEMSRSCSDREKAYWQRELKKLRKKYVPLLNLFSRKKRR